MVILEHPATFNLVINPLAKDGDCAFCSVVKMIKASYSSNNKPMWEHLKTLGLLKTEEILKESKESLSFIPTQDRDSINMQAEEFKQNGVFERSLGNLVMKVCAHILKLPIHAIYARKCTYEQVHLCCTITTGLVIMMQLR